MPETTLIDNPHICTPDYRTNFVSYCTVRIDPAFVLCLSGHHQLAHNVLNLKWERFLGLEGRGEGSKVSYELARIRCS